MGKNGCREMGRFGRGGGSIKRPIRQERVDDRLSTRFAKAGFSPYHTKSEMPVHAAEGDDAEFVGEKPRMTPIPRKEPLFRAIRAIRG